MIRRTAPLLCWTLAAAALFALTGCEAAQLPEGYAWNLTTQEQNEIQTPRAAYRWGFDQGRINENLPTSYRDRTRYDFAAALPTPNRGEAPAAPAAAPTGYGVAPQPYVGDVSFEVPREPVATAGSVRVAPTYQVVAPQPVTPAPAVRAARTHTVQKGDNYWDLAKRYYGSGARFLDIQQANPGLDPTRLQIGQEIVIPE